MTEKNIHLGIQIVPLDQVDNMYKVIDAAIDVIQNAGFQYVITPMETIIEAPYDQANRIARDAQRAVLDAGCGEFLVNIRMHIRSASHVTMEEKGLDR